MFFYQKKNSRILPQVPPTRPVPPRLQVRCGGGELPVGGADLRRINGHDRSSQGECPGRSEKVQNCRHQGGLYKIVLFLIFGLLEIEK